MRRRFHPRASSAGFSVLEIIMAMALLMLIALSTTEALLTSNRLAATNRVLTAARAIVQRNLDLAMSQRFDSATVPAYLGITPGTICDDDGGGDNSVNILIQKQNNGTQVVLLRGTLTRVVSAEPNPQNADVRRVTFRLNYTFQRRAFVVEMTGLRAIDD